MKKALMCIMALVMLLGVAGCDNLDDDRITGPCRIDLGMIGTWTVYGVQSVGDYRVFIRERSVPSNFPYTATTYTGNGGVLLMGVSGSAGVQPVAYEMACPYCRKHSILIEVDNESLLAVCRTCDSHFDVLMGSGQPVSGPAHSKHYGLHRYNVRPTVNGGYLITN